MRAVQIEKLTDEELKFLKTALEADGEAFSRDQEVSDTNSPFAAFRRMERLAWLEVSISLVDGDLIQISARKTTKRVSYSELGLVDRRIGKGQLNSQGQVFLDIATRTKSKHSQYKKHLSRLRGALQDALGIKSNPFSPTNQSRSHSPVFEFTDDRKKADQRARIRASRRSKNYDDKRAAHQLSGSLASDLSERTEEYPFEESPEGLDETDNWLKENG